MQSHANLTGTTQLKKVNIDVSPKPGLTYAVRQAQVNIKVLYQFCPSYMKVCSFSHYMTFVTVSFCLQFDLKLKGFYFVGAKADDLAKKKQFCSF